MEPHITILDGKGIRNLAHASRILFHRGGIGWRPAIILVFLGLTEQLSITGSKWNN
jgi:hypothetical protein